MATAWILCEDGAARGVVAMALADAGFEDIVAFEDARQLVEHAAEVEPGIAVVDVWTSRFDRDEVRARLADASVLLLTSKEDGAPWDWAGVRRVAKPAKVEELRPVVMQIFGHPSDSRVSVVRMTPRIHLVGGRRPRR